MDEFGVLTERYGLKPQGKSAPMASIKRSTPTPPAGSRSPQHSSFDFNYGVFASTDNKTHHSGGFSDGFDEIFGGNTKSKVGNGVSFDDDPIFGSVSTSSSSSSQVYVDDIFGGVNQKTVRVDDLLNNIGGLHATNSKSSIKKSHDFDDFMSGFGGSSVSNNGKASIEKNNPRKPTATPHDDPFLVFETSSSTASSESFLDSLEQITKNSSKHTSGSSSTSPLLRPPPKPVNASNSSKDSFKYLS